VPDAALTQAEVVDAPESSRYELRLGGRVIGFVAYRRRNDRIVFTHTEVDESYEGCGLGSRLAEAALEDVRGKGLVIVPLCPFIARYIEQHPEYHELVGTS
jgi:predicted GNAT family acetyltransferase